MKKLEADFRIVTPCFLGGAAHNAELRVPSIKGALRFWWRALAYARYGGDIKQCWREEQRWFGSSDRGQSPFLMRLVRKSDPARFTLNKGHTLRHGKEEVGSGIRYLGYGLMKAFGHNAGELERSCLWQTQGFDFTLHIMARDSSVLEEITPAVKMLGLVGSVGSRSRKGFGSLTLVNLAGDDLLTPWRNPSSKEEYQVSLQALLEHASGWSDEPGISAFSDKARIDWLMEGSSPLDLMNEYGQAMVQYRSWQKEKNFVDDHDWFKKRDSGDSLFHPQRVIFGLPHNYYSPGTGKAEVRPEKHDRRASPLFFHVHQYGRNQYAGISLLMQSRFLPDKEKIKARNKPVPSNPDWSVLTRFLDNDRYFPNRSALWPTKPNPRSGE